MGRTPKEKVLATWRGAYATRGHGANAGLWYIGDLIIISNIHSNYCRSAKAAWQDAARRLKNG